MHESTEVTDDETHSEQEEQPVQVPNVMANVASLQRKRRRRGRSPGQGSAPRRDIGRGCVGDFQG